MKQLSIRSIYKSFAAFLTLIFINIVCFAQDNGGSSSSVTTHTTTTTTWYTQPWVWIAAGAVFILLLVALLRGGSSGRSDRVTITKTSSDV
jgi:cell division protein FtsW (lipid II flippase)